MHQLPELETSPSLNITNEGIDLIPYFTARSLLSSMSTFTKFHLTLKLFCKLIYSWSKLSLHGPHHSTLKSTITGTSELRTSSSKLPVETSKTELINQTPLIIQLHHRRELHPHLLSLNTAMILT